MRNDRVIRLNSIITAILWAATAVLFTAAASAFLLWESHWSILVAEVACGLSAFAAVRHIKTYIAQALEETRNAFDLGVDAGRLGGIPRQPTRLR